MQLDTSKGTRNALPASTQNEYQNTFPSSGFTTFFNRQYTDNTGAPGGAFDDIVLALKSNDLFNPLIKDGVLKSAPSQFADQTNNIKNALGDQILRTILKSSCSFTLTLPTNLANDPWGGTVSNTQNIFSLSASHIATSGVTATYTLSDTPPGQSTITVYGPTDGTWFQAYPYLLTQCP